MPVTSASDLHYDPYDADINADPYPVYRKLREEAPLYYSEEHDFYAVSRYDDVDRGLTDPETFISGRGNILELIKSDMEIPSGVIIFEDPPIHATHRRLMGGVFSPRKVAALEPKIRDFTVRCLDPLVGAGGFDFIADIGAQVPMRTIGMLLGIPENDQEFIRDRVDESLRPEAGEPMDISKFFGDVDMFTAYIDWRAENPSDDIMTDLLRAEFEDEDGVRRRLNRDELLTYVNVIAGAGNETTNRLIGWTGKVLADHPDQRRELVENPALIPGAVEEVLRFESPSHQIGRYVAKDAEIQGRRVPAGSAVIFLNGSANRDDRHYPDGDRFDIHRGPAGQPLTFGRGLHFCLGTALARMEGRIVLEEVLKRFPEWEVDQDGAQLGPMATVRGWDALPVHTP